MGKRIILVAGCTAAGKTTFSTKLSAAASVPCFNKDLVKAVLGQHVKIHSRTESKQFSKATFYLLKHIAEQFMKAGFPIILESNFNTTEAKELSAYITQYAYEPLTYVFHGDLRTMHRRFVERENSCERDCANRMFGLWDEFEAFQSDIQAACLTDFDVGGIRIPVDTTCFERVDFCALVRKGVAFLEGQE